ncbi:MAG: hypothetical protein ABI432_12490 [Flavobacteriales bacterium]
MIIYLTYNDQPSGVYWSQVTDVVEHLNTFRSERVKLVALVSARGYLETRRSIRSHSPSAWVIPMVPTMARWRRNVMIMAWVCRILGPKAIIARGVMATWMALRVRERKLVQRVCFDGRGAYAAEWEEYRIIDDDALIAQFRPLEQEAVNASDFRLAVSNALVAHWRERYAYSGAAHVVVPCTLGKDLAHVRPKAEGRTVGADERIRLVYSGSSAGWQSFELLERMLVPLLEKDERVDVMFLTRKDPRIEALERKFPGRVSSAWFNAAEVGEVLREQDGGILVRENTVTNQVSSPTKFAEYLACGLPVIISGHIGDLSQAVERDHLGGVVQEGSPLPRLERPGAERRAQLMDYAHAHFTKSAHNTSYTRLLAAMTA